jgi:hypothetical protein
MKLNARGIQIPALIAGAALAGAWVGCGSSGGSSSTSTLGANPVPTSGTYAPPSVNPANFVSKVDNPYFPLTPGTTLRYRGVMKNGTTPQTDTFAITHKKKQVMGIGCTVVSDMVTSRGRPVERTFDWFAQDRQGNVWYMGEETQELKHGTFGKMIDSGPAGKNGAQPGLAMEAHPVKGDSYWQFHWPGHALDTATVLGSGGRISVPYGSFKNTLLTQEQSPLEPGVKDQKWSVPGIGYVQERAAAGTKEQIKLVSVTHHGHP